MRAPAITCTLPATIGCPLPTCASLLNNCRTNQAAVWSSSATPVMACATPSPPPPSSTWVAVTAAISVVGYTVNTFGSSQQAAFAAVLSAQLYVPASSVQITSVSAATSAAGRHRRLHQAASGVTVAFTVTATSSTAANNLAASITNMAVSPTFVAALQSGGLPAASATALATAPSVPATSYYNPPPSGGGGGYQGQYYGPTERRGHGRARGEHGSRGSLRGACEGCGRLRCRSIHGPGSRLPGGRVR